MKTSQLKKIFNNFQKSKLFHKKEIRTKQNKSVKKEKKS